MKLLPLEAGKKVQFEMSAEPGSQVFVAGTFNNWNPVAHALKDTPDRGQFKMTLCVPAGTHEYKFIVDGVWSTDPKCPCWRANGYGTVNSVLHV